MASTAPSVSEFKKKIEALEKEIDLHIHEEENLKSQVRFETLLSELSAEFVNVPADAVSGKIKYALQRISETLGVERCSLAKVSHEAERISIIQAWPGEGIIQALGLPVNEIFPWLTRQISKGKTVSFNSTEELPPEAAKDRKIFEEFGGNCMLLTPIYVKEKPAFAITLISDDACRDWSDIDHRRLKLIGEVFANALIRKESEEEIQKAFVEIQELRERLEAENVYLREEISLQHQHERIIGQSKAIEEVLTKVEQVAGTDSTVLILGETGTGKGLVAWAIHEHSQRYEKSMVKVNCAALPASLIESELFGREKGAYTGAVNKQLGRFEFAHESTIFLDEIGEVAPEIQAKLLGVLEDGRFERLGSAKTIEVDVRIIAATNRNLPKFVRQEKFREDLFFRLNVFPIVMPPLRERQEDIPLLAWHYISEFEEKMGKRIEAIPNTSLEGLKAYPWPGNVRELRNVIEHAMIITTGKTLKVKVPDSQNNVSPGTDMSLKSVERRHMKTVLERCNWRIRGKNGAADILDLKPSTLYYRMEKLGLKRPS